MLMFWNLTNLTFSYLVEEVEQFLFAVFLIEWFWICVYE